MRREKIITRCRLDRRYEVTRGGAPIIAEKNPSTRNPFFFFHHGEKHGRTHNDRTRVYKRKKKKNQPDAPAVRARRSSTLNILMAQYAADNAISRWIYIHVHVRARKKRIVKRERERGNGRREPLFRSQFNTQIGSGNKATERENLAVLASSRKAETPLSSRVAHASNKETTKGVTD